MFPIKYITIKSSARDQPLFYLFIGHLFNLVVSMVYEEEGT
jgi:hypothetical protein